MMQHLVLITAVMLTLQISKIQARRANSDHYEDKYFNSNQKYSHTEYTKEFAHLAARYINFIGIGGTSERTGIPLKAGGPSQFQDQSGSDVHVTNAAHQIQARIDPIPANQNDPKFIEMRNRLGHTDELDVVLNRRIGTVIDDIQKDILKDKLLQRIHFEDGATDENIRVAREIQRRFIAGIETESERLKKKESNGRDGKKTHPDFDPKTYHVLKDLLIVAKDTYMEEEAFNEGLKAGIINFYNELKIEGGKEITTNNVPPPPFLFPTDNNLSSKAILGRRQATRTIVNIRI